MSNGASAKEEEYESLMRMKYALNKYTGQERDDVQEEEEIAPGSVGAGPKRDTSFKAELDSRGRTVLQEFVRETQAKLSLGAAREGASFWLQNVFCIAKKYRGAIVVCDNLHHPPPPCHAPHSIFVITCWRAAPGRPNKTNHLYNIM